MNCTHSIAAELTTESLARRLGELALSERRVQVDFLIHLDEFDRRRGYLAGYASLWEYCLRALHLREGAAGRRIAAMRVLRRFPGLEEPLRDGRLCLSTASLLGQVLTDENLDDLVARAAYKTKEEVDHLVATLRPRPAPREGVRRLPISAHEAVAAAPVIPADVQEPFGGGMGERATSPAAKECPSAATSAAAAEPAPSSGSGPVTHRQARPVRVRALSETEWSLTIVLDSSARKEFELLGALLSHKCGRNPGAILREAIRCAIEKHGKRRGVVAPKHARQSAERGATAPTRNRHIPAEVRRQVVHT